MIAESEVESERISLIYGVLYGAAGLPPHKAAAIYDIMTKAPEEERANLLEYAALHFDIAESAGDFKLDDIELSKWAELQLRFGPMIDAYLKSTILLGLPETDFYKEILKLIYNPIYEDEDSRRFATFWILFDPRIPYFKLPPGLKMANDEYKRLQSQLSATIQKISFALNTDFSQKTEKADVILKLIDSTDARDERVVLLSKILAAYDQSSVGARND